METVTIIKGLLTTVNGVLNVEVNMILLTGLGIVAYFAGQQIRKIFPILVRLSIPAPVLGGLPIAFLVAILERNQLCMFKFDATIQTALQVMFFCTVGMNASIALLKRGTLLILAFFAVATLGAVFQNIIGMSVSKIFSIDPRIGIVGSSVALTGGLGTAGAFGPYFENMGVTGAAAAGIACATFGMIAGSMTGGPFAEFMIARGKLKTPQDAGYVEAKGFEQDAEKEVELSDWTLMKNLSWLLFAMGLGSVVSLLLTHVGITLPGYLGAMFVAIFVRNFGEITGAYTIDSNIVESISDIALAVFISMAILSMKLAQLVELALPLLSMMVVQLIFVFILAFFLVYLLFGRDYEASVMGAGFIGFMMGNTANALVCMQAVTSKYGNAPKAYFVVPIVGAFLIDITNAAVVTYMGNAPWLLSIFGLNL